MSAVSLSLLLIFMSGRFVKYLAQAASGDVAGNILFSIMFYRMPAFLELILPLGLFLGILLAYGRLYAESEMIVLFACGISKMRLLLYTLVPAGVVMLIVASFSLYFTPLGLTKYYEIWENPENFSGVGIMVPGRFQPLEEQKLVSYTEEINADRTRMQNVFVVSEDRRSQEPKMIVIVADSGRVYTKPENNARYIELHKGFRYEGNPGALDFRITRFETLGQLIKEPETQLTITKTDAKPSTALLNSNKAADLAALQWRISIPITVPIVALIALSLSETNPRRGRFMKLLPAILIYIFYIVVLIFMRSALEEKKIPASMGMWWVHLVFLSLGIVLLYFDEAKRRWIHRGNNRLLAN